MRDRAADRRTAHLRDADDVPDLALGEVVAKTQLQNAALAWGQAPEQPGERRGLLGGDEAGLIDRNVESVVATIIALGTR